MLLSKDANQILNLKSLVEIRDNWFKKLQMIFDGTYNNENVLAVFGLVGCGKSDPYIEPEKWVYECLEDISKKADEINNDIIFKPLCVEYGIYGVHFIDKILGANVYFKDGQWYNDYLKSSIGTLKYPDLENCEIWELAKKAALAFKEANQELAVFGLPTIASTLNIAVNLYGEEILVELLIDPKNALKDLKVINKLLIDIHTWFISVLPKSQLQPVISWCRTQPPGFGQICGCTTQLISSEAYEELIAPLDSSLLAVYKNGGMIHLCGSHLQHLQAFSNMKELKAFQLNDRAAHDLEGYYKGLRDDQIIYLNPCSGMTIERAMEITNGNRLVIADGSMSSPVKVKTNVTVTGERG